MLRQELQAYLDRVYPNARVETEHSIFGPVHIRFELGGDNKNGTKRRVKQATERAFTLFNETFRDPLSEIYVLVYEYGRPGIFGGSNEYLHQLFETERFAGFYNEVEQVHTRDYVTDEQGNEVLERRNERIIIGRLPVKDIKAKEILNGIANLEMGFDPGIAQRIIFLDPAADKAFLMYDDRGCYVWSDKADKIRDLYVRRRDWIVDYHREEIDAYFR
jgi:uncharacterized protein DUF3885